MGLAAVGMLPVADQFSLYGKIGMYRADSEFSTNIVLPGIPQAFSESNNDLTFGFGLQFDISRNFGVRAEYQRYQDLGGPQIGESDLDVMSIGVGLPVPLTTGISLQIACKGRGDPAFSLRHSNSWTNR